MNSLAITVTLFLSATEFFTQQTLNDIEIGAINPFTGQYTTNFRLHDMNKDNKPDLVFTDHVILQENGQFPPTSNVGFPKIPQAPLVDIFAGKLYFKMDQKLLIYELQDLEWVEVDSISTPWKTSDPIDTPQGKDWGAFILDLDSDTKPEAIHSTYEGLDILHLDTQNILPPQRLISFPTATLTNHVPSWQLGPRYGYTSPGYELSFRCVLEDNNLYIIERIPAMENMQRYTVQQYTLNANGTEAHEPITTSPLHNTMQPCRINSDTQIDYAGGALRYRSNTSLIAPIYEFSISTDGGKTLQSFHSKSFFPHTYFIDFNQDGLKDILMEETNITDGGLRQTVSRLITQRNIKHRIHIYQQQSDETFPSKPTITKEFTIRLDKSPINKSTMFQRYQNGFLVNAVGNINGDGFSDLIVQTTEDRLDIYYGNMSGYVYNPQAQIEIEPNARFFVLDINGDKLDDIVISTNSSDPAHTFPKITVYYSNNPHKQYNQ